MLSVQFALFCTAWQLRLLLWSSRRLRKMYLWQSAGLFLQISQLTQRKKLLEQKLTKVKKGDIP